MRLNKDDIKWMKAIEDGNEGEVPPFNVSRLRALDLVEEAYECLSLTDKGKGALRGGVADTRRVGGKKL